jgi:two-component system response regulator GlrR
MKQTLRPPGLLYIGNHPDVSRFLAETPNLKPDTARSMQDGLMRARQTRPRLVLADASVEGMASLKSLYPTLPVITLKYKGEGRQGVQPCTIDCLPWPDRKAHLLERIQAACHAGPLDGNWRAALLTCNPVMEELLSQAYQVSQGNASLLIGGASGTGKELLARAIHTASARRTRAFVAVNCSAIPEHLFESELFGHCKGAFTGAIRNHSGLMRAAHGGTLFLDEIGEMPRSFQAKLLRSLQERQVRPVGGIQDEPVDIRVISATHVDLNQAMKDGAFREDLYYRLNVVSLNLPKLSERPDDIAWLVDSFLEHLARSYGEVPKNFTPDALNLLKTCPWPGNVRQLRNVVEHCVALSTTSEIAASLVSKALCHPDWSDFPCFEEARTRFEQDYLLRLMHITAGNVARAARLARRNRTEFYRLLTRHCIEPSTFQ